MNKIRGYFGFSFTELEALLVAKLRELLGECLVSALSRMDCELLNKRDPSRYQAKGFEQRTLETAMGQTITFRRRQYYDRDKGQYVFLLDEALELKPYKQISPLLGEVALETVVNTASYRKATETLEAVQGHRVMSHETARQLTIAAGEELETTRDAELKDPQGDRRVPILFVEVDGLWVSLQQQEKGSTEEKMLTSHEGWQQRYADGKLDSYELVGKSQYRCQSQGSDFWENASRFVYSRYDITDETIVVINGDRANWIRRGTEYFPRSLYQIDWFHLTRDIRRLFGDDEEELSEIIKILNDEERTTGEAFIERVEQGMSKLRGKRKKQCAALIKDLKTMPEATVDYRIRLKEQGVDTTGLRRLGAAESQAATFADRVKGRGRS